MSDCHALSKTHSLSAGATGPAAAPPCVRPRPATIALVLRAAAGDLSPRHPWPHARFSTEQDAVNKTTHASSHSRCHLDKLTRLRVTGLARSRINSPTRKPANHYMRLECSCACVGAFRAPNIMGTRPRCVRPAPGPRRDDNGVVAALRRGGATTATGPAAATCGLPMGWADLRRRAALLVARVPAGLVRHAPRALRASPLGPARLRGFMKPVQCIFDTLTRWHKPTTGFFGNPP